MALKQQQTQYKDGVETACHSDKDKRKYTTETVGFEIQTTDIGGPGLKICLYPLMSITVTGLVLL